MTKDGGIRGRPALRVIAACAVGWIGAACNGGADSGTNDAIATSASSSALAANDACGELAGITLGAPAIGLPTSGATVTSAALVPANGAAVEYCRVQGAIHPVDSTAPDINFEVNLPSAWNHKALQFGGSGYNGFLVSGLGDVPQGLAGEATPLNRGYATFGSDSGHGGGALDGSFGLNHEALANFGGDSLKKTHDVALALIAARYGCAPQRMYFAGGSGGGREAFAAVQRWPRDYDGALVHYPAYDFTAFALGDNRVARTLYAPGAWMNANQAAAFEQYTLDACDSLDGVKDGIISHPAACDAAFHVEDHRCPDGTTGDGCFTDAQIAALKALNTPLTLGYALQGGVTGFPRWPVFEGGDVLGSFIYGDLPTPSNPPSLAHDSFPYLLGDPLIRYPITRNANFDSMSFDPEAWRAQVQSVSNTIDASSADLSGFEARGGKMMIVHGAADFLVSPYNSVEYYQRLLCRFGQRRLDSFLRFYLLPGMGHNTGSFIATWDSLTVLEHWVEGGRAPGNLVATDGSGTVAAGRTRPMCKYPTWPKYTGTNPNDASSFTCVSP